jgi:hypothetical protein
MQTWSFSCIPLGVLMMTVEVEILQVTLDRIDMLLASRFTSS